MNTVSATNLVARSMPRVVIIGGSFAGNRVRALLPSPWEVLVVDARPYWEFTPGMLRCWVEPGVAENLVRPHGADVIVAQAEAIHGGTGESCVTMLIWGIACNSSSGTY